MLLSVFVSTWFANYIILSSVSNVRMIIQNLVLPQVCDAAEGLYARSMVRCSRFPLELGLGDSVSFATYFNYFSLSKWRKYTTVDDQYVFLKCEGRFEIRVDHHVLENGSEIVTNVISFESDGGADVKVPSVPDSGMLSITVTSLSDSSVLFGGGFRTESAPPNGVRIGVNICTYWREKEIADKIERFLSFVRSADKDFSDSVELFIIDNGNTLDDSLNCDNVHVIPNKNLGGSGGFTRGMMEIVDSGRFSHILMNDDDALFEPESLYRTWSFLSFLKGEYNDAHIGGAMLMSEKPNIVHEAGAMYSERGRILRPVKGGLDVSDPVVCLMFDEEGEMNYLGWWYLVLPVSYVRDSGYPLPLFIKWDDIEYGIRNTARTPITLNGVSVWHESFKEKAFAANHYNYYFARNYLVIGCTTDDLKRRDVTWMLRNALFEAICYRYECAEMMFRGVRDFFRGPEFVFDQCVEGMVKPLPMNVEKITDLKSGEEFEDPDGVVKKNIRGRMLTMNGLLLPSKRNVETSPGDMESSDFYRVGKVLYNIDGVDGFVAERSFGRTLSCAFKLMRLWLRTSLSFGRIKKRYRESLKKYSSEENWRTIFNK